MSPDIPSLRGIENVESRILVAPLARWMATSPAISPPKPSAAQTSSFLEADQSRKKPATAPGAVMGVPSCSEGTTGLVGSSLEHPETPSRSAVARHAGSRPVTTSLDPGGDTRRGMVHQGVSSIILGQFVPRLSAGGS